MISKLHHFIAPAFCFVVISVLCGCRGEIDAGPPTIYYGDSMCHECGMIISDERFATATIIEGDRGNEPLLFDDFNCQMILEAKLGDDIPIINRWSHDHATSQWLPTADAWFVRSSQLRTPMASNLAAFLSKDLATALAEETNGEVIRFDQAWP